MLSVLAPGSFGIDPRKYERRVAKGLGLLIAAAVGAALWFTLGVFLLTLVAELL